MILYNCSLAIGTSTTHIRLSCGSIIIIRWCCCWLLTAVVVGDCSAVEGIVAVVDSGVFDDSVVVDSFVVVSLAPEIYRYKIVYKNIDHLQRAHLTKIRESWQKDK